MCQIPWWEGPEHSWQVRLMLVTFGGYKWVLPDRIIYCFQTGCCFLGIRSKCSKYYKIIGAEDNCMVPSDQEHILQPITANNGQRDKFDGELEWAIETLVIENGGRKGYGGLAHQPSPECAYPKSVES